MQIIQMEDTAAWNDYVFRHPNATPYHVFHWQNVISKAYGFKTYNLGAVCNDNRHLSGKALVGKINGILPLVHMKSPLLGSRLVSMPFFDHGGVIADNSVVTNKLLQSAVELGKRLKVHHIELRQIEKIDCFAWDLKTHKVRLMLPLPSSSEALMKSFKAKLRSQINRPLKAGFTSRIGGSALLDDFYQVFSINMRDLGSPVHAKAFPECVINHFKGNAKIVVIYKKYEPVASAMMVGFKDIMINPWASALRQYSKDSPNMLLYWTMLSYAADKGFRQFDFGRSTPDEGTYRFKTQWGAQPQPMYWYTLRLNETRATTAPVKTISKNTKRTLAANFWSKMPIPLSRLIGPMIRKHIDL